MEQIVSMAQKFSQVSFKMSVMTVQNHARWQWQTVQSSKVNTSHGSNKQYLCHL